MRPLSKKGRKQAAELVGVLEPYPMRAIFASDYVRCVETMEPVGRARGLDVNSSIVLGEGRGLAGLTQFLGEPGMDQIAICTHGDIVWELVEDMVRRHVIKAGEGGFEKGSTWVIGVDDEVAVTAEYLPAP